MLLFLIPVWDFFFRLGTEYWPLCSYREFLHSTFDRDRFVTMVTAACIRNQLDASLNAGGIPIKRCVVYHDIGHCNARVVILSWDNLMIRLANT